MTFAELSNSPEMYKVLFFCMMAGTCLLNWTALNLTRRLYDNVVEIKQRLPLLIAMTVVPYGVTIYAIAAFHGFRRFSLLVETILVLPSPLLCVAVYLLITRLWQFPIHRLVNIMRHTYLYTLVFSTTGLLLSRIYSSQCGGYYYWGYFVLFAVFLVVCSLLYQVGMRVMKHKQFHIHIPDTLPIGVWPLLSLSLGLCVASYAATVVMLQLFQESVVGDLILSACLTLILTCDIFFTYKASLKWELEQKNAYIASLVQTVDKYIHLRRDLEEILETYDSYLEQEDMGAIARYQESLMGKTSLTMQSLSVAQRIAENPSLVALLLKKIDYAQQMNVTLHLPALCSMKQMPIQEFDLGRLLGNLLNNAIEAAAISPERTVTFSMTQKNPACKLIVIANSTAAEVDIEASLRHGTTTKDSHTGIGLTQVRNIVRKYEGCVLHFASDTNEFIVYLELRM